MRDQIYFYLPGFFNRMHMQMAVYQLMEKYPEAFYENIRIGAVYGSFPGAVFNGGRTLLGDCSREQAEYVISEFARLGIRLRFTFTNPFLTQEHLQDPFCNMCLELAQKHGGCEVLVNSPLLEAYMRKEYADIPLISSTTKQIKNVTELSKELEKDYKLVVADKSFNNTEELFSIEGRQRLEILVDSFCMDDCPRAKEHYDAAAKAQLEGKELIFPGCRAINRDFYEFMENKSFVTVEDLYGRYARAGFRHFKLDGRTYTDADVIESYIYYMVRPQMADRVRLVIHKTMEKLRRI